MARVLVVDDEHAIRELLRIVFEGEGYDVVTLPHGAGVIPALDGSEEPCVVLLDLMMPLVTGWQVCEQLIPREDLLRRHAVIVMTAAYGPDTVCPAPAVTLLRKPFLIDAVLELVRTIVSRQNITLVPPYQEEPRVLRA
jgi:CheY-like chemotaxis protein